MAVPFASVTQLNYFSTNKYWPSRVAPLPSITGSPTKIELPSYRTNTTPPTTISACKVVQSPAVPTSCTF
ncbi:MAG: hypothetical protein IPO48_21155 [Saprospiraceae bacterium]|nr:hypothetical protein [Saprospiraceae bacterium]